MNRVQAHLLHAARWSLESLLRRRRRRRCLSRRRLSVVSWFADCARAQNKTKQCDNILSHCQLVARLGPEKNLALVRLSHRCARTGVAQNSCPLARRPLGARVCGGGGGTPLIVRVAGKQVTLLRARTRSRLFAPVSPARRELPTRPLVARMPTRQDQFELARKSC